MYGDSFDHDGFSIGSSVCFSAVRGDLIGFRHWISMTLQVTCGTELGLLLIQTLTVAKVPFDSAAIGTYLFCLESGNSGSDGGVKFQVRCPQSLTVFQLAYLTNLYDSCTMASYGAGALV